MISYLKGGIAEKLDNKLIIECGNIGYEVYVSNNTYVSIGSEGEYCKIYTFMQVKEDGISLFGFSTTEERDMFNLLISVSGIGPKVALSILSGMKLSELMGAIASGDSVLLTRIKGLGKKTAERVVLELQDKVSPVGISVDINPTLITNNQSIDEACTVLISLGLNKNEAYKLARQYSFNNNTAEGIVQQVLKNMGG